MGLTFDFDKFKADLDKYGTDGAELGAAIGAAAGALVDGPGGILSGASEGAGVGGVAGLGIGAVAGVVDSIGFTPEPENTIDYEGAARPGHPNHEQYEAARQNGKYGQNPSTGPSLPGNSIDLQGGGTGWGGWTGPAPKKPSQPAPPSNGIDGAGGGAGPGGFGKPNGSVSGSSANRGTQHYSDARDDPHGEGPGSKKSNGPAD